MAENSYPFGVTAGTAGDLNTEDQWTKMARLFAATGVAGDPGSTVVQVFGDSTGMLVKVRAGRAIVRGVYYENTATKNLTIAANSTGSTRIDRIVLKLDPTSNTVTAVVKQGSTTAPALTQDDLGVWEMPLARVTVANGAVTISPSNVTDERVHTDADVIPCRTTSDVSGARFGSVAAEFTTGLLKWWNGTQWLTIPNFNDLARQLAYQEFTSNVSVNLTSGVTADIPGMAVTVTTDGRQRIRLRADLQTAAAQNALLHLMIREGSTQLQTRSFPTGSLLEGMWAEAIFTPAAGTHTYKVSAQSSLTMQFTVAGSATTTSYLFAEYLGVNS